MALRQGMRTEMHGGVEAVAPSAASTRVRFAPGASDSASDAGRIAPAPTAVRARNANARCVAPKCRRPQLVASRVGDGSHNGSFGTVDKVKY